MCLWQELCRSNESAYELIRMRILWPGNRQYSHEQIHLRPLRWELLHVRHDESHLHILRWSNETIVEHDDEYMRLHCRILLAWIESCMPKMPQCLQRMHIGCLLHILHWRENLNCDKFDTDMHLRSKLILFHDEHWPVWGCEFESESLRLLFDNIHECHAFQDLFQQSHRLSRLLSAVLGRHEFQDGWLGQCDQSHSSSTKAINSALFAHVEDQWHDSAAARGATARWPENASEQRRLEFLCFDEMGK